MCTGQYQRIYIIYKYGLMAETGSDGRNWKNWKRLAGRNWVGTKVARMKVGTELANFRKYVNFLWYNDRVKE